jgi:hypothetical protein
MVYAIRGHREIAPPPLGVEMDQWEYHFESLHDVLLNKAGYQGKINLRFQRLGWDGWEFVTIEKANPWQLESVVGTVGKVAIFKRKLTEERKQEILAARTVKKPAKS